MKEILIQWWPYLVMLTLTGLTYLVTHTSKKNLMISYSKIAVEKVAEHYANINNIAKLDLAVDLTYQMLPAWLKWMISKKYLKLIVEESYQVMKAYIKNKKSNNEGVTKHVALATVGQIVHEAINLDVEGDQNICTNIQLKELQSGAEQKINEVYGNMKYKTDFKSTGELLASLGFKKYF